jgi:hypothetical protein
MPLQVDVSSDPERGTVGLGVGNAGTVNRVRIDVDSDKLKIGIDRKPPIQIELTARRTLDGNILILDHEEIDIVLIPNKRKCIVFAKEAISDEVYGAQDRLFKYLSKGGVVDPSTVRSGNVYGSMEGMIHESSVPGVDGLQAALFTIYEYIRHERPYYEADANQESGLIGHITEPDEKDTTELGDIAHKTKKGSMDPKLRPFGYMYNYSLLRQ